MKIEPRAFNHVEIINNTVSNKLKLSIIDSSASKEEFNITVILDFGHGKIETKVITITENLGKIEIKEVQ